ncbi:hypothetical protein SASPL_114596 [Salvia splendens]|uniref:Uncharacterized protein n=1 Tax=Salvia splendens TaxID=180675 RepID=A0A8X9A0V2_SALSN|nr:hypothetical protein SASPL_114596 [Salvia splendens]
MALEKGLIKSKLCAVDRSDIKVNVIGKGRWRHFALRHEVPCNIELPYSRGDCEKWAAYKLNDSEDTNGDIPNSPQAILTAIYVDLKCGNSQNALAKLKHHTAISLLRRGKQELQSYGGFSSGLEVGGLRMDSQSWRLYCNEVEELGLVKGGIGGEFDVVGGVNVEADKEERKSAGESSCDSGWERFQAVMNPKTAFAPSGGGAEDREIGWLTAKIRLIAMTRVLVLHSSVSASDNLDAQIVDRADHSHMRLF